MPSLRMSLTLAHQSRIRSMYSSRHSLASQDNNSSPASELGGPASSCSGLAGHMLTNVNLSALSASQRPDSSSSTSSVTDWESGLSTVRRQPPSTAASVKSAGASSRNVEDISAFSESNLRLRVKATNNVKQSTPSSVTSHGAQALRRRHRSVERQLQDSSFSGGAESVATKSVGSYERFSAAVFHHNKLPTGKNVKGTSASTMAPTFSGAGRMPHPASKNRLTQSALESHGVGGGNGAPGPAIGLPASDHEMETSSAIFSLRVGDEMTPAGGSVAVGSRSIQDHIIATQMNRLNREMPISDVYHERNMGLGLAPPLSELLVTSAAAVAVGPPSIPSAVASGAAAEGVFSAFDQISLADNVNELTDKAEALKPMPSAYAKRPPPARPIKPWMVTGAGYRSHRTLFDAHMTPADSAPTGTDTMTLRHGIAIDMTRRDEADGRSMTDSNYSGYSPHRSLKLSTLMPSLQTLGRMTHVVDSHQDETGGSSTKVTGPIQAVAIIEAETKISNDATLPCS